MFKLTKFIGAVLVFSLSLQIACAQNGRISLQSIDKNSKGLAAGDYQREFRVDGRNRRYELHVPRSYKPGKSMPLILAFHGGGGHPGAIRYQSGFDDLSERVGFIVAYPAGSNGLFNDRFLTWNTVICCGYALKHNVDEVEFVSEMLDDISRLFTVDTSRVYATGISNGGLMSFLLASKLSDRIAAVAPVSGQISLEKLPKPRRPVPIMYFHGIYDQNARYGGGYGQKSITKTDFEPVIKVLNSWAYAYGCGSLSARPLETRGQAERQDFQDCPSKSPIVLWTLKDGGHTWPGGKMTRGEARIGLGKINRDISASDEMWEFFKKFSLPR